MLNARTASDIDTAFASLVRERASALVVGAGGFLVSRRNQIITLAARNAIPTIYGFREYPADGGLISYGNNIPDAFRQAGVYTGGFQGRKAGRSAGPAGDRIRAGHQSKTAKALGLSVPWGFSSAPTS